MKKFLSRETLAAALTIVAVLGVAQAWTHFTGRTVDFTYCQHAGQGAFLCSR